jgi:hypothetical protein
MPSTSGRTNKLVKCPQGFEVISIIFCFKKSFEQHALFHGTYIISISFSTV